MTYKLVLSDSESIHIDELEIIGRQKAEEILLPEYLTKHGVSEETARELYEHMGYLLGMTCTFSINPSIKGHQTSYETIRKLEKDHHAIPKGQLEGLVEVALGIHPPQISEEGLEIWRSLSEADAELEKDKTPWTLDLDKSDEFDIPDEYETPPD